MTALQQPIHSGFDKTSTTTDVLAGIDLTGKLALVTGGYSGLGLETTRAFAGAGAHVIVPARRADAAREALADVAGVEVAEMDLADLDSVRAFAEEFLASGRRLDIVVLSAAIMANPHTLVGPGWESQFATNHLGHFALVGRLWPALSDGARVVVVSSDAHRGQGINWDDLHWERGYDRWKAYGQSKTANILFARHLDALGQGRGVRAFALHPGVIRTPLQRHFSHDEMVELGWVQPDGTPADWFRSVEQGAATQVWAATSPALDGLGGQFLADCNVVAAEAMVAHATDPDTPARLWALSADLTGVDLEATSA